MGPARDFKLGLDLVEHVIWFRGQRLPPLQLGNVLILPLTLPTSLVKLGCSAAMKLARVRLEQRRRIRKHRLAVILCGLCGCTDQQIQQLLPGRAESEGGLPNYGQKYLLVQLV